jgi:tRNA A-37 threonylcarbamoyl transferase component Bud32
MPEPEEVIPGGYKLLKQVAEGAFGKTYLAEKLTTGRRVAVKIDDSSDEIAIKRLTREARALDSIDCPHVVRFIDVGTMTDGRPFLVLEYIEGPSLDWILQQTPLPLSDAESILEAVTKGLAAAHARGVIHRDVKPSNIVLPGFSLEKAKLVDFGGFGDLEEGTGLTRTGQVFGTPYYMAPEQLRGEAQSTATDIYGLGAVFFEMIFGHPPFAAENPTQTIVMSLSAEPVIPSSPRIPADVRSFIKRCLSKNPQDRPASANDALIEITRFRLRDEREGNPLPEAVSAGSVADGASSVVINPIGYQPTATAPSRSAGLLIKSVAIGLVLVGLGALTWTYPRASPGIAIGLVLALGGLGLGLTLPKWFAKRKTQLELDAGEILQGARSRISLSQSIAIEVDQLIARVRRLDERILAKTLAIMLEEYQTAVDSQNRQAALMNVASLLDKLMTRLAPWYIRHEKLIAFAVSFIGVLSGAASIIATFIKIQRGQ